MNRHGRLFQTRRLLWMMLVCTLLIGVGLTPNTPTLYAADDNPSWLIDGNKPPFEGGVEVPTPPLVTLPTPVEAADAGLTVDVWYGDTQNFGHNGEPIRWINVFGNVESDGGTVTDLDYKFNNQSYKSLDMGPTGRRLADPGDFAVEIAYADLNPGNNTVLIRARDSQGRETIETVTVVYDDGNTWQKPYVADWADANKIEDVAQVVDGHWVIDDGKLRPIQFDYDRLVGLGDKNWEEFEITVPVTIHSIDEGGFNGTSGSPGVGLIQRWQGHFCWEAAPGPDDQLCNGWQEFGAIDWFRWEKSGSSITAGLQRVGATGSVIIDKTPSFETTYILKGQTEKLPVCSGRGYYRFKVWEQGDPEPTAWNMAGCGSNTDDAPNAGSVLLVAHHVDASFGPVTLTELDAGRPELTTSVDGPGSVDVTPDYPDYTYLEEVTLTPTPNNSDYAFSHWSGDVDSTDNPLTLNLTEDTDVTAHFVEADYTVTVNVVGQGSVSKNPDKQEYMFNEDVTLTATPDQGWGLEAWSGSLTGNDLQAQLTVNGTEVVTATFALAYYTVTITTADSEGVPTSEAGAVETTEPANPAGYAYGEQVTLTAMPTAGWTFLRWEGDVTGASNPISYSAAEDKDVTAVFEQNQYTLDTTAEGNGAIVMSPNQSTYTHGTEVVLQAISVNGWDFDQWADDLDSSDNPVTVTMDGDKSITAQFTPTMYTLNTNIIGEGSVQTFPAGPFTLGQSVQLYGVPRYGWKFDSWSGDVSGSSDSTQITIGENSSVTAWFSDSEAVYLPLAAR